MDMAESVDSEMNVERRTAATFHCLTCHVDRDLGDTVDRAEGAKRERIVLWGRNGTFMVFCEGCRDELIRRLAEL